MHFSSLFIWLTIGAAATKWPDVVTMTTTQTQYAPWEGIVYQDGDVCYCPLEISTPDIASSSTSAIVTSLKATATDVVVHPGGSTCPPTDGDLGPTTSVPPLTPGQSTLATSQAQSEAHFSSFSQSASRSGIIPSPASSESRSLPNGQSSAVNTETTSLHFKETTREEMSTTSLLPVPSCSQTIAPSQGNATWSWKSASPGGSTSKTGSVVPSVSSSEILSSKAGEPEGSRQPISSAHTSQPGTSSRPVSGDGSSKTASFSTKPRSEISRQPMPSSSSIPESSSYIERSSPPIFSTRVTSRGRSTLKPVISSPTVSSPTFSKPVSSNTLISSTPGDSSALTSSAPNALRPSRSSQPVVSSQSVSSSGSSNQEGSSTPVSSHSSTKPASSTLSSSKAEISSASSSSKSSSSSVVTVRATTPVNSRGSTSNAVISSSGQPPLHSSKQQSSTVSPSSSRRMSSKLGSSTLVSSSADTTIATSPSVGPSKTSSSSESIKYTSCVPTAAFAVEDSAKLAPTSTPGGPGRRGPVEVFGRAKCSPGTFRCISTPSGWEACDTQGKWIFAGVCPPATHCVYYPEDLGLLCLPPC